MHMPHGHMAHARTLARIDATDADAGALMHSTSETIPHKFRQDPTRFAFVITDQLQRVG